MLCFIFVFVAALSQSFALEWVVKKTYSRGTDCQGPVKESIVSGPKDVCFLFQRENGPFYRKLTCSDSRYNVTTYSDDQCTMVVPSHSVSIDKGCLSARDYDQTFDCNLEAPAIIALEFVGSDAPSCTPDTHQKEQYLPYGMCLSQKFSGSAEWTCLPNSDGSNTQVRFSKYTGYPNANTNCSGISRAPSFTEPRFYTAGASNGCSNGNAKLTESYRRRYYKYQSGCPEPTTTTGPTTTTTTTTTTTEPPTTTTEPTTATTTETEFIAESPTTMSPATEPPTTTTVSPQTEFTTETRTTMSPATERPTTTSETSQTKFTTEPSTTMSMSPSPSSPATIEIHATITGRVHIEVSDADAFLADIIAQFAVKEAIAEELGVPTSYVTLVVTKAKRRLTSIDRRLAGKALDIDYNVDIPKSASNALVVVSLMANSMTTSSLQSAVASKMTAAKGSGYTVTIASSTSPAINVLETTTLMDEFSEYSLAVSGTGVCSFWIGLALLGLACI